MLGDELSIADFYRIPVFTYLSQTPEYEATIAQTSKLRTGWNEVDAQYLICLFLFIYATIYCMAYVPLRKAVEFLGLHPHTLRKYADEGKIKSIKNEAGQRLYDVESYQRGATRTTIVCYCRVSSAKQRDDLARQVEFMEQQYPDAEIIQEIGSGLNFKRKGLQALLVRFMRGEQLTIVVACKDRLCRFGFELFQFMA
ncbi:IS607 family transposase, partial [Microcoleus vaginatus GB1-A2]|uniref:IS607 family transposase n=1 Tax=Microcoleus vaginatus TaxID=119532 RepID=UPI0032A70B01